MDTNNSIVRLCVKGMESEGMGHVAQAREFFQRAWEQSTNDFERCIAAHYVARHQDSPAEYVRWNQEALDRAMSANRDVLEFYPSLYLNLAKAHEDIGNYEDAKILYESAASKLSDLPEGAYGDVVRDGIERGLERLATHQKRTA
jgi:tetratricopeptide (TPR) repeat protein